MINVKDGIVELEGIKPCIEAEFSTLVYALITDEHFGESRTRELVETAFDIAKKLRGKSEEEKHNIMKDELKSKMDKSFDDMFDRVFGDLFRSEED